MKSPVSVNPIIVTSPFGDRAINGKTQFHHGVDLRNFDKPIIAIEDGIIKDFGTGKIGEGWLDLQSARYIWRYIHVAWIKDLKKGMTVNEGDAIGVTNLSGTDSLHLHLGCMLNGKWINACRVFTDNGINWKMK